MTHATKITEVFLEGGNDDHRKGTVHPATWMAVVELSNGEVRHQPIADEFDAINKAEALALAKQSLIY